MKEVAAAIMNGLTRRLEEAVDEGMPSEATQKVFDPVVFWCVNAIWMTVLAGVVIWIWKCGGAECLTSSVRNSDIDYRRRLAQRERDRIEKRRVSPEKRRTLLMEYFRARKVHMVSDTTCTRTRTRTRTGRSMGLSSHSPCRLDLNDECCDDHTNSHTGIYTSYYIMELETH